MRWVALLAAASVLAAGCMTDPPGTEAPVLVPDDAPGLDYAPPPDGEGFFELSSNPGQVGPWMGSQETWMSRLEGGGEEPVHVKAVSFRMGSPAEALALAREEVDCAFQDGVLVGDWFVRIGAYPDERSHDAAARMAERVGGDVACDVVRDDDGNDGPEDAVLLTPGPSPPLEMGAQGDEDWYAFTLAERSWVQVDVTDAEPDKHAVAFGHGEAWQGRDADRLRDYGPGIEGVAWPGTHTFSVVSDHADFVYGLHLRIEPLDRDRTDRDNSPAVATDLTGTAQGVIEPRFEEDWYRVPPGAWRVSVEANNSVEFDVRDAELERLSETQRSHGDRIDLDVEGPAYVRVAAWDQDAPITYTVSIA